MKVLRKEPQELETEFLNHKDLCCKANMRKKKDEDCTIQWKLVYHKGGKGKNMITFDMKNLAGLITTSLSREIKAREGILMMTTFTQ